MIRAWSLAAALIAAVICTFAAPAVAAPPDPGDYQDNDYLGFRNVMPPGQNGFANINEIVDFSLNGIRPSHNDDQLSLYDGLLGASPGVTDAEVDQYYKDASFGVPSGSVASTYGPNCAVVSEPSPASEHCDDVTIVRDTAYGVPHIYGADRAALMFGIGYASAEDRLFTMDVQRHAGRAELSSFLGGNNVGADRSTWRDAPYTDEDLQAQFDAADDLYGDDGAQIQADVTNYVDGINQYIAEARVGPASNQPGTLIPGEYGLTGHPTGPEPFREIDVLSVASLVAGIFGKGGGGEVKSALALEAAQDKFGDSAGRAVWEDFRSGDDDEAPTTVRGTSFPYLTPPDNPTGTVLPDPGTVVDEPVVEEAPILKASKQGVMTPMMSLSGASNALLVSGAESATGSPIAVMGPQTSYFSPGALIEQDIHAPGGPEGPAIDARGVAFAGANIYVQLGRGQDYAWSATSAGQDIIDTYALPLCEPGPDPVTLQSDHYEYDGNCEPFEVLERENSWTPNAVDATPAGSETLQALRTKLGIVTHRGMVNGAPTAFTRLRATYFHEADSAIGFADFNSPEAVDGPESFQEAANKVDYTFNWFYADDDHIAYFNSGANPVRAANTDADLPIAGVPANTWENFDPDALTFDRAPFSEHAQTIDQDYISSWNNKQAPGFRAADDKFAYGPVQRVDMLNSRIEAGIAGSETMTRAELVDAMEDAATVDFRGASVLGLALKVVRSGNKPVSKKAKQAIKTLDAWRKSGAHRRDTNGDGVYEQAKAVRLMDAWWPRLVQAEFRPTLGSALYDRLKALMGLDNPPGPAGSAYNNGWWGYVSKDLRSLLSQPVDDPYSREYCGGGKLKPCRVALRRSLNQAIRHSSAAELYPGQVCNGGDAQWCADSIRHRQVGGISQPPIDWQNRPTFQQVVTVQGHRN